MRRASVHHLPDLRHRLCDRRRFVDGLALPGMVREHGDDDHVSPRGLCHQLRSLRRLRLIRTLAAAATPAASAALAALAAAQNPTRAAAAALALAAAAAAALTHSLVAAMPRGSLLEGKRSRGSNR